ncbi:MAG: hypothetical protein RMK91_04460 [Pseudanabaenaceae cyanobacterium SKYGB_i_bin29]|nr:hypothetical protein [Pseudanabaenaceae cyanobacterium SKYG29]MDW8421098.1 hypothetical protein [Pseudanabaenaceae cyanobacterium SKYGB_i_bin29]
MLLPLSRQQLNELLPLIPTREQYEYYWGTGQDLFRRIMVSVAIATIAWVLHFRVVNTPWELVVFIVGAVGAFYWLLGPVPLAMGRNAQLRKYPYSALWWAVIDDCYLSEEVSTKQEKVDERGRLDVSYATESFINLELGDDDTDIVLTYRSPMQRIYKRIEPGEEICLIIFAADRHFTRLSRCTSDAYIPSLRLWVSDYPYLRRDSFKQLVRQIRLRK